MSFIATYRMPGRPDLPDPFDWESLLIGSFLEVSPNDLEDEVLGYTKKRDYHSFVTGNEKDQNFCRYRFCTEGQDAQGNTRISSVRLVFYHMFDDVEAAWVSCYDDSVFSTGIYIGNSNRIGMVLKSDKDQMSLLGRDPGPLFSCSAFDLTDAQKRVLLRQI